jgi:hypothetical protein
VIGEAAARRASTPTPWALAIAALLFAAPAFALELTVGDADVQGAQPTSVAVRATDARGLSALQMRIAYDSSAVEIVEVAAGSVLSNALIDFKVDKGICTIAFAAPDAVSVDGDLLILKLKVRRAPGSTGGSALRPENAQAWGDPGGKALAVSVHPGQVAALGAPGGPGWTDVWKYLLAFAVGAVTAGGGVFAWRGRSGASPAPGAVSPAKAGAGPHFCSQCGAPLAADGNFCANCGAKIARG